MMDDFNGYAMVPREEDYFGDVEFMLYTYKVCYPAAALFSVLFSLLQLLTAASELACGV